MVKTRFMITSIAVHLSRIAVGDCRDGILFYSYQEVLPACIVFRSAIHERVERIFLTTGLLQLLLVDSKVLLAKFDSCVL